MPASSAPNLGTTKLKENPGNSSPGCASDPKVPSLSVFFSPPFRVFSCLIYNVQGFKFYVTTGKSISTPSSWKQKSRYNFKILVSFMFLEYYRDLFIAGMLTPSLELCLAHGRNLIIFSD